MKVILTTLLLIGLLSFMPCGANSDLNESVKSRTCGEDYTGGGAFDNSVAHLFSDLATVTPTIDGYIYQTNFPGSPAIFGNATCDKDLIANDCSLCIQDTEADVAENCPNKRDAKIELGSCTVFYSICVINFCPGHFE